MSKTLHDIPNISAPKTRQFKVSIISHIYWVSGYPRILRSEENKVKALAASLGGQTVPDHRKLTEIFNIRRIGFMFGTYIEALAFVDGVNNLKSFSPPKISYVSDKGQSARLHPTPSLVPTLS